jgi:hypothetical protein
MSSSACGCAFPLSVGQRRIGDWGEGENWKSPPDVASRSADESK